MDLRSRFRGIDKELRKFWEQDEARTNASLMNLVVYSEKPGALLENSAIIRNLTREHACRAILVEIDRAEPLPSIRAWITAHCHLAHGRKSVCCEQIAFYLTGIVTGRFRNTVFAHLNSDLPLVFWWQGELSDILTERLVSVMDRLIVDSSSWADPAASFRRIEEASQINTDLILQDHAWTRTWQFRIGVASIFDDPAAQRALPEIDSVEITYHPAHRNSCLQLLAWLAMQAGWKDRKSGDASGSKLRMESPSPSSSARIPPPRRFLRGSAERRKIRDPHPGSRCRACETLHSRAGLRSVFAFAGRSHLARGTRRPATRPRREKLVVPEDPAAFQADFGSGGF